MIQAEDYILLAENLALSGTEAEWRTAVSRAYYAAYHAARDLLETLQFAVPHAARAHAYLWLRLANCGDASVVAAGSDLHALSGLRNHADYDIHLTLLQSNVQSDVQKGRAVVTRLRAVLTSPTPGKVPLAAPVQNPSPGSSPKHADWISGRPTGACLLPGRLAPRPAPATKSVALSFCTPLGPGFCTCVPGVSPQPRPHLEL